MDVHCSSARTGSASRNSAPPPSGCTTSDRSPVRFGDLAHDRQAEPGSRKSPRGRAAVEAVEDVGAVDGGDAWAVIADRDAVGVDRDFHDLPPWGVFGGVLEEVADGTSQPVAGPVDHDG